MATATKTNDSARRPTKTVAGTGKFNWLAIIIVGWMALVGFSLYERIRPASDWLDIQSLTVSDTTVGTDPIMVYDRVIKQPFVGNWVSEVQKLNASGKWTATCIASGVANYSPDKEPPTPLTLSWWTYPVDCTPTEVGKYRVYTTWQINWPGPRLSPDTGRYKETHIISNTFNVT